MKLCVYPKDPTTEFLSPVYDAICKLPYFEGLAEDTLEDAFFETFPKKLEEAEFIVFLGHGSSTSLFGTNLNPIAGEEYENINEILRQKPTLLFACRSKDFIDNFNLSRSLGFGVIPTEMSDYQELAKRHKYSETPLVEPDIEYLKDSLKGIWKHTIEKVPTLDLLAFSRVFAFYIDMEIVDLLRKRTMKNFRQLADILYFVKQDMMLKQF